MQLDILRAFGITIEQAQNIISLSSYTPVYRFNYENRYYVLKRTGVRSDSKAIAAWTKYLV